LKRLVVTVVVAVLVVGAVATAAIVLLGTRPSSPTLDRVEVTAAQSQVNQRASLAVSARAFDTAGVDETRNATFTWSVTPAGLAQIETTAADENVNVRGLEPGILTVQGTAEWRGASKNATVTITIRVVLDQVLVTAGSTSADQRKEVPVVASAIDTDGMNQTGNAAFVWTAEPSNRVLLVAGTDDSEITVVPVEPGTVTVTAAGTWQGTAKSDGVSISITALAFTITASNDAPFVGTPVEIRATVMRSDSTIATGYTGTVTFASDNPLADLPSDYQFTSTDAGVRNFTGVVLRLAGSTQIMVRDTIAAISGSIPLNVQRSANAPVAIFNATRTLMHVDTDASATTDPDGDIAWFNWTWGDGTTTTGVSASASHNYAGPGIHTIVLNVTDFSGNSDLTARKVTTATSTIDYDYYDFFAVPYPDYWDLRPGNYWELPMNAECFNASSVTTDIDPDPSNFVPLCSPSNPNVRDYLAYPFSHWYSPAAPTNPNFNPSIWAPFRFQAIGNRVPGYTLSEPVFLPVLAAQQPAGSLLDFDWYMDYLNYSEGFAVSTACGTQFQYGNDGYVAASTIHLWLDLQESRRMFGVVASTPSEAQAWWDANTDPRCIERRDVENATDLWFSNQGGTQYAVGKYDITNGFEWYYQSFGTNMTATVDPSTGETLVTITHFAWGTEVLLGRWFYWGNASYVDNYLNSTRREGWWGMENSWFEDFHYDGSITANSFDFALRTVLQYHLQLVCDPGLNGVYDRADDVPTWVWGPFLVDYENDFFVGHPYSEIDRYPGDTYAHCLPGAQDAQYGAELPYDYTPITWDPLAGETWHFQFPTGDVTFYDPNLTPPGASPTLGQFVEIHAPLELDQLKPTNFGDSNPSAMTWDVLGPASTGGPDGSPGPDGVPGTADDQYAMEPWPLLTFAPGSSSAASLLKVSSQGLDQQLTLTGTQFVAGGDSPARTTSALTGFMDTAPKGSNVQMALIPSCEGSTTRPNKLSKEARRG
jgi:hypothetical protein